MTERILVCEKEISERFENYTRSCYKCGYLVYPTTRIIDEIGEKDIIFVCKDCAIQMVDKNTKIEITEKQQKFFGYDKKELEDIVKKRMIEKKVKGE